MEIGSEDEDDSIDFDSEDEEDDDDYSEDDLGIYPPSPVPNSGGNFLNRIFSLS